MASFDANEGAILRIYKGIDVRKTFVNVASKIVADEKNSVLLLGDIGVYGFQETLNNFPERAINIGILEQCMVGVASGFASEGVTPIVHTIAPFMVERALEQIKIDFGYQKLGGNFVSVGASFDYTKLGCTHHCPADINILSNIPGMNLFIPGHSEEFEFHFKDNWNSGNLNYFRLSEHQNSEPVHLKINQAKKVKFGQEGAVFAVGPILGETLAGLENTDVEIHYLNNFNFSQAISLDTNFPKNKIIIIEPYYSGAVLLALQKQLSAQSFQILQIGVPRKFIDKYGTYIDFVKLLHLDSVSIRERVEDFIYDRD